MSLNFSENWKPKVLTGGISITGGATSSLSRLDWSLASYFTLQIEGITGLTSRKNGRFIPVKSVTNNQGTLDTLALPIGIFSDLAFAYRRKLRTLQVTCLDISTDYFENEIRKWFENSVPHNGYVSYLTSIVRKVTINLYSPQGKLNQSATFMAMLTEGVSSSRAYDTNGTKEFTFSMVVVGNG